MPSTDLALTIEAAGCDAGYDDAAKRLLSFKSVIAWILKLSTGEFMDYDVGYIASECISDVSVSEKAVHQDQGDEVATMMNSESSSIKEGKVYYDLRLRARDPGAGRGVGVFINIEIQNDDNTRYSLVTRGLYYCARMLSEQHGTVFTNMDYQKIEKAYSIWISIGAGDKERKCSISRYRITKEDTLGKSFINEKDYDKMEVVVIRLGRDFECSADSITGLLSALLSSDMEEERRKEILGGVYGIAMTKEFESGVTEVCNLSEAVRESGRKEGFAEGLKEGSFLELMQLVDEGDLSIEKAAKRVDMTVEAFLEKKRVLKK